MAVDDIYTKSLLHFEGADASTTFTDESGKTWSRGGNAQINTAQYKFGGASGLFDGVGDFIYHPGASPDTDFAFGTGDFTIDFWYYCTLVDASTNYLYSSADGAGTTYPTIYFNTAGKVIYGIGQAAAVITGTTALTSAWIHIAVVRYSGNTKLYINGTQEGSTYADSNNYSVAVARPVVMADNVAANEAKGYIDELRVSKGIARWTANFTPPTLPYGIGGQVIIWGEE